MTLFASFDVKSISTLLSAETQKGKILDFQNWKMTIILFSTQQELTNFSGLTIRSKNCSEFWLLDVFSPN